MHIWPLAIIRFKKKKKQRQAKLLIEWENRAETISRNKCWCTISSDWFVNQQFLRFKQTAQHGIIPYFIGPHLHIIWFFSHRIIIIMHCFEIKIVNSISIYAFSKRNVIHSAWQGNSNRFAWSYQPVSRLSNALKRKQKQSRKTKNQQIVHWKQCRKTAHGI